MAINDLNTNAVVVDSDLIPIWDGVNGRTRNVYASTLKTYTSGKAYTSLKFEGENLMGYTEEDGWQIIGQIPSSTIKLSGGGLPDQTGVSGINFSEEFEVSIDGLTGEISLKQTPDTIVIDGETTEEIQTGQFLNADTENNTTVLSYNTKIEPWIIQESAAILLDVVSIDSVEQCGIEYLIDFKESTVASVSFHLFPITGNGLHIKIKPINMAQTSKPVYVFGNYPDGTEFSYNVTHSTVFSTYERQWRVEESSQLLSVEKSDLRSDENIKKPVHGIAIDPNSSITQSVTDEGVLILGGGDGGLPENPTFKSISIDTFGSGNENFKSKISQDGDFNTVIDATKELRISYKDIGTGLSTSVFGIGRTQAQFLVQPYYGNDALALAKDVPNTDSFIQKHTNAELNKLYVAYQGKYNENRVHYPAAFWQDVNGWTQLEFTGNMLFKSRGKDTGSLGDKILEVKAGSVATHKKLEANKSLSVTGDLSAVDDEGDLLFYISKGENLSKFFLPFQIDNILNITKSSGIILDGNRGAVKIWSTGAIEVPFYTNFRDNELVTKKYVDEKVEGAGIYTGQGLGVPDYVWMPNGTNPTQTQPVGLYGNTSNDASSMGIITLNDADGYTEFEVIINCLAKPTRDFRVKIDNLGKYSDKRIRTAEIWSCRVKVDWDNSINSSFFWTRLDDGSESFRNVSVLDAVETIGFDDASGVTQITNVEDIKYRVVDLPNRINKEGTVEVILDSNKPVGAIQIDNVCNYNWDYPELVIMLYVDDKQTSLGGFRIPYGLGAELKYNLDNKAVSNYKNGYWTWTLSVVDWSILRKAAHAGILDQVDASGFDAGDNYIKVLKKRFENKDMVSIPIEIPEGFEILVSSVICKSNGRIKKQPFEYEYSNGILRVHLNEICTGVILAELIK